MHSDHSVDSYLNEQQTKTTYSPIYSYKQLLAFIINTHEQKKNQLGPLPRLAAWR
jgi:hypothetical protein